MKIILLIILSVVGLAACKKENEPTPEVLKTYISKQILAGIGTYTWNYDVQNRLQSIVFVSEKETANPSYTYRVTAYDASNSIAEVIYDYISPSRGDAKMKNTFDVNGKLISRTYTEVASGAVINSNNISVSGNTITLTTRGTDNEIQSFYVYTYSADGKNVIRDELQSKSGIATSSSTYLGFDNKKNYSELYPIGYGIAPLSTNNFT